MNTVDERILIPAPPQLIWDFVSNIENIPAWQNNCRGISYLTSVKQGRGVRWRKIALSGRDQVWETTAWYEGVGFEYQIVDGVSFKSNMGRIRIQDTPDGVMVQWTFSYDPGGVLGGLRSALSLRRSVENEVVDGLWALWREITAIAKDVSESYVAKSLMREAPDAESRANYTPRHPSVLHDPTNTVSGMRELSQQPLLDDEPPITQDDTRPRPVVTADAEEEVVVDNVREPDFLSEVPDTDPGSNRSTQDIETYLEETLAPEYIPDILEPRSPVEVTQIDRVETPFETPPVESETIEPSPESPEPSQRDESSVHDTSELSVFDVFGIRRPTEENEVLPVEPPPQTRSPEIQTQAPQATIVIRDGEITAVRVGLRIRMRRKLINIRPTQ